MMHPQTQEQAIQRARDPSMEDFRQFLEDRRPVLIEGAVADFPAARRWSEEYLVSPEFRARCDNQTVEVCLRNSETATIADRKGRFEQVQIPLSEFLDGLMAGDEAAERFYLTQCSIDKLPALEEDFLIPAYLPREGLLPMNLWIGRNTVSPIHYDLAENLLCQIHGEKKLILIPPEYGGYLYMSKKSKSFVSPVNNAEEPDLRRFPLFARAPKLEVVLRAGDGLYLPRTWFHYVRSNGLSISANFWWVVPS